jgi:hypothetical protein
LLARDSIVPLAQAAAIPVAVTLRREETAALLPWELWILIGLVALNLVGNVMDAMNR